MKANQINAIRNELLHGKPPFQRAVELRAKLEAHAEDNYHAKNPPSKVVSFICQHGNGLQLKKVHPSDSQVPYVWQLFTPKSQWVPGDCPAECFDRAMKMNGDWSRVSSRDINALILAHQAIKEAKAENTVQCAEVDQ